MDSDRTGRFVVRFILGRGVFDSHWDVKPSRRKEGNGIMDFVSSRKLEPPSAFDSHAGTWWRFAGFLVSSRMNLGVLVAW